MGFLLDQVNNVTVTYTAVENFTAAGIVPHVYYGAAFEKSVLPLTITSMETPSQIIGTAYGLMVLATTITFIATT